MKRPIDHTYDLVGLGFGPSNLALSVALEEQAEAAGLRAVFLEQKPAFAWHPHMLIEDTVMQISFLKDLVTQRNPESRYSFVNYLRLHGRLSDFINLKTFYPTREEFNRYMAWVAREVRADVRYGSKVLSVESEGRAPRQTVQVTYRDGRSGQTHVVRGHNLVVAVGGQPKLPPELDIDPASTRVWHSAHYLDRVRRLEPVRPGHRFVIVGRGQSAAEIAEDLHGRFPEASVTLLFRGYGLKPSDSSEFINGLFDGDFVDEVNAQAPAHRRRLLDDHQDTNYAVVDAPLISRLFQIRYRERVTGLQRLHFRRFTRVTGLAERGGQVELVCEDLWRSALHTLQADTVVMATGYEYPRPPRVLAGIAADFDLCPHTHQPQVTRHYRAALRSGAEYGVYLQGCNEPTHGLGDTLLSNLAVRAGEIVDELLATPARTPWPVPPAVHALDSLAA